MWLRVRLMMGLFDSVVECDAVAVMRERLGV